MQGFLIGYPKRNRPDTLDFYARLDESMMFFAPATWRSAQRLGVT